MSNSNPSLPCLLDRLSNLLVLRLHSAVVPILPERRITIVDDSKINLEVIHHLNKRDKNRLSSGSNYSDPLHQFVPFFDNRGHESSMLSIAFVVFLVCFFVVFFETRVKVLLVLL